MRSRTLTLAEGCAACCKTTVATRSTQKGVKVCHTSSSPKWLLIYREHGVVRYYVWCVVVGGYALELDEGGVLRAYEEVLVHKRCDHGGSATMSCPSLRSQGDCLGSGNCHKWRFVNGQVENSNRFSRFRSPLQDCIVEALAT